MRVWKVWTVSVALVISSWVGVSAVASAQNVAFVTMNRLLEDSPQAEEAMRELEREFSP
ncbi:MAG: OmpH family outer membrane protein, partial [Thioalkalivibrio sp.]|nr:OmpH family outer membrane protein [Thioalkalivibrio sp.]